MLNLSNSTIYKKLCVFFVLFVCLGALQGCSLLKIASSPFKNSVSKVPESTHKTERKIKCKGEIELDSFGRVIKCGNNYYSYEKNYSQEERRLTIREKLAQFIMNAQGYMLWFVIICVVLTFSGFGWVVSGFFNVLRGTGRVARDLVTGISKAKKHIRQNGSKYIDTERKAYHQALDDMMNSIDKSVSSVNSKKIINKLRAEAKVNQNVE